MGSTSPPTTLTWKRADRRTDRGLRSLKKFGHVVKLEDGRWTLRDPFRAALAMAVKDLEEQSVEALSLRRLRRGRKPLPRDREFMDGWVSAKLSILTLLRHVDDQLVSRHRARRDWLAIDAARGLSHYRIETPRAVGQGSVSMTLISQKPGVIWHSGVKGTSEGRIALNVIRKVTGRVSSAHSNSTGKSRANSRAPRRSRRAVRSTGSKSSG